MAFTALSEDDIKQLLSGLTSDDAHKLVTAMKEHLVAYSCQNEQQFQPERSFVLRPDGQRTMFMPSTTPETIGVKIVGIAPSTRPAATSLNGSPPASNLCSALTLFNNVGQAIGILNADELSALRTALGSILLYQSRKETSNIVVFGAGKQAEWHIRLAVLLRPQDIHKIVVVNRSPERTQVLIDSLVNNPQSPWPPHIKLHQFDKSTESLEELVVDADVMFCCTPSTEPLFPAKFLTSESARRKTRYLATIGSFRVDMIEIDPELLKAVVDSSGIFSQQVWRGYIATDASRTTLKEAGEIVNAGIEANNVLEVGQILGSTEASSARTEWLESGFVIYKGAGLGVEDIAVGRQLLQLAKAKSIGTTLAKF